MKQIRLILVGFGVVGQGFAELLMIKHDFLKQYYRVDISLLGVANARHGFVYRQDGLHLPSLLELVAKERPLTDYPGITHWDSALEGLQANSADILVEVTPTNLRDAEPGMSHIRMALSNGMHVVTANKGPAALAASELISLARQHGVQLRMESTVMAGTPVISTIREGITAITREQIQAVNDQDKRMKLIASLRLLSDGAKQKKIIEARVEPSVLPLTDPLARVDGVTNALTIHSDTLSEVTIIGPGAGSIQTGQGLLADVLACVQ